MRLTGLREVADHLGVGYQTARKYSATEDFPEPAIKKGPGMCSTWNSEDIDAWNAARPGRGVRRVRAVP